MRGTRWGEMEGMGWDMGRGREMEGDYSYPVCSAGIHQLTRWHL